MDNKILRSVGMFDLYQDNKLDESKKSMSFRIKFQSKDRTLTDEEVDGIMNKIIEQLADNFNAIQR